jgi:hypothetical protein
MEKRFLIMVLANDREPWRTVEVEGQRATWASRSAKNRPVLWLHGRTGGVERFSILACGKALRTIGATGALKYYRNLTGSWTAKRPVVQEGDRVVTGVPESYLNANPKTIAGLRHVLNTYDFDYIFRTNTSTYINLKLLEKFIETLPDRGYYGGFEAEYGGVRFASGTGILLSRDVAQMIVEDPEWEFELIDDVAIGRCMRRMGVDLQPFDRVDVLDRAQLDKLDVKALKSAFFVRCKGTESREHDVIAMRRVHRLYQEMGLA